MKFNKSVLQKHKTHGNISSRDAILTDGSCRVEAERGTLWHHRCVRKAPEAPRVRSKTSIENVTKTYRDQDMPPQQYRCA